VVFAGYGITAPDLTTTTTGMPARFAAGSCSCSTEPGSAIPPARSAGSSRPAAALARRRPQAKGAIGILYVSDVHNHPGAGATVNARGAWPAQPSRLGSYSLEAWMTSIRIPAAQISTDLAARLVKGSHRTLEDLARTADTPLGAPAVVLPGAEIKLTTAVNRTAVPDRNILAKIDGSDPRLRDEWIVISAHFDHDGANGVDHGADDTVRHRGLLEIAMPTHWRRSRAAAAPASCSRRGIRKSAGCSARGPTPRNRWRR
jgi:hypothetical protein